MKLRAPACGALCMLCVGCAPPLDWREIRPAGSGAVALFPCKPKSHARTLQIGPASTSMALYACSAGGTTYAFAHADIGNPEFVGPALVALRDSTAANLGGAIPTEDGALRVPGMTPNPRAVRIRITGHLPGGEAAQVAAGFFAKGTRVFQITLIGAQLDAQAVQTYFSGVRVF